MNMKWFVICSTCSITFLAANLSLLEGSRSFLVPLVHLPCVPLGFFLYQWWCFEVGNLYICHDSREGLMIWYKPLAQTVWVLNESLIFEKKTFLWPIHTASYPGAMENIWQMRVWVSQSWMFMQVLMITRWGRGPSWISAEKLTKCGYSSHLDDNLSEVVPYGCVGLDFCFVSSVKKQGSSFWIVYIILILFAYDAEFTAGRLQWHSLHSSPFSACSKVLFSSDHHGK